MRHDLYVAAHEVGRSAVAATLNLGTYVHNVVWPLPRHFERGEAPVARGLARLLFKALAAT